MLSAQTPVTPKTFPAKAPAKAGPAGGGLNTTYKYQGSANAPVTIEAFTDYECPHCALFFKQFMPQFTADYIATGKVRFVHRDFPLVTIHTHAQQAARLADAAGEAGFYDLAVSQLFKTQDEWSMYGKNTGNMEASLAMVIPPGGMQKIRELVKNTPHLDAEIANDLAEGNNVDHINSTPTIVVVTRSGKREPISDIMNTPYTIFKKYLDSKIAGQ